MIKPISPQEASDRKQNCIPGFVIEAFNEIIAKKFDGREATFCNDDVIAIILQKGGDNIQRQDVFANGWLDIEELYRKGWNVSYNKSRQSGQSKFTFVAKSKRGAK